MTLAISAHTFAWAQRTPATTLQEASYGQMDGSTEGTSTDVALEKAKNYLRDGDRIRAQAIYEAILQAHPETMTAYLALVRMQIRELNFATARQQLEAGLSRYPSSAEIPAELGHLFHTWTESPWIPAPEDYRERAFEYLRQAQIMQPNHPLALTYLASWHLAKMDVVLAERALSQALQQSPNYIPALQEQVRFYIGTQNLDRARLTCLRLLDLDERDMMTHFLLAQLLASADQPAEAVASAKQSEQLDFGRFPERDHFLAKQLEKLGELQASLRYYEGLRVYKPNDEALLLKIASLYEATGQAEQGLALFREVAQANPTYLAKLAQEARTAAREGRYSAAIAQWRRLALIEPDLWAEALHGITNNHYALWRNTQLDIPALNQDLQWANQQLSEQGEVDPLVALDLIKLEIARQNGLTNGIRQELLPLSKHNEDFIAGEAAFLMEDYASARERLEYADGPSAAVYLKQGDRLLLEGALFSAEVMYRRGLTLTPLASLKAGLKQAEVQRAMAERLVTEADGQFDAKKYAVAVEKYRQAIHLHPQWDMPYIRLGDTYERMKQNANAYATYRKAVQLQPGLMDAVRFAKRYEKLAKEYGSAPVNPSPNTAPAEADDAASPQR
ncbi:MAG: hypothetical protein SFZ03_06890 [Candidatus Melainabacteria bacterium]|nr:hypothetical protein [Candidatus Melainabacteria bacterium]